MKNKYCDNKKGMKSLKSLYYKSYILILLKILLHQQLTEAPVSELISLCFQC